MSNEYPYASMRDSFDLSAYFVVGPEDCKGRPLTDVVDQALHGGATFIQLRAKEADASELTDMARDIAQIIEDNEKSDSVAFVIDDRADVVFALKGISPALCVEEAMRGMLRGKTIIVPSALMRAATTAQHFVPTPLLMPIMARQQKKKLGGSTPTQEH